MSFSNTDEFAFITIVERLKQNNTSSFVALGTGYYMWVLLEFVTMNIDTGWANYRGWYTEKHCQMNIKMSRMKDALIAQFKFDIYKK